MCKAELHISCALKPIHVVSRLLGLVTFAYGKTTSSTMTRYSLRIVCNEFVFLFITGWFLSSTIFDCLYHHTKHSNKHIIPVVCKMCTVFGAALVAVFVCHRGTQPNLCGKLLLADGVLLVPSEVYTRRNGDCVHCSGRHACIWHAGPTHGLRHECGNRWLCPIKSHQQHSSLSFCAVSVL